MEALWLPLLAQPAWYLTVIPEIQAFLQMLERESAEDGARCKQELYDFFELHLSTGDFALGSDRGQFDNERLPIDTVVIHHTSNPPGLSPIRLSAIELMRLYGPYFVEPPEAEKDLRGKAIISGHERNGKQVFWPYHWLVRDDGCAERLLFDSEIGWHAGNWEINCRSIAIALDNDYEDSRPSNLMLRTVAALIATLYGQVPMARVIGHQEVNGKTICPSARFLNSTAGKGWKSDLMEAISHHRHVVRNG